MGMDLSRGRSNLSHFVDPSIFWTLQANAYEDKDYTVPAMDVDIQEARYTFETNFFAVIRICQTFLPLLIKSKGTIVQIGSIAGVSIARLIEFHGLKVVFFWKAMLTIDFRSFHTSLDQSTMRLRLLSIRGATRYELNLLRLGASF